MDIRDNKTYTVRRMCMEGTGSTWQEKEVNCARSMLWMTQNLDLDLNSNEELSSANTDLRDGSLSGAYETGYRVDSNDVIYWKPATTTITSINSSTGKFNGWSNNNNVAYSADPSGGDPDNSWYVTGDYFSSNLCLINNNDQTCNYLNSNNTVAPIYFSHTPFASNGNHGKIGNYYNWSAAIASNNSSSLTTSTYNNVDNNPQNSICPKGWRLPTVSSVTTRSEFAMLRAVYNSVHDTDKLDQGLLNSPVYMTRSGDAYDDSIHYVGHNGTYWSSTVDNMYSSYILIFRSNAINSSYGSNSRTGSSIRCVSDY